jgi:Fe-S-cluster containining protein
MKDPTPPGSESIRLRVDLAILGAPFQREFVAPAGPIRPIRMLPLFQAITDEMVRRGAGAATRGGKTVSCKAGCTACCHQIIPVGETEARRLAALVEASPGPRREALRARFAQARQELEAAGLWETLAAHASLPEDELERLGLAYLRARVACPFLDGDRCSIYADRPLSCREFLVTSPAPNCWDPTPETIDPVALPSHPSDALARIDPGPEGRSVYWMPLVSALDFAAAGPDEHPPRPAIEHLNAFLGLLVALGDEDPAPSPGAPKPRPRKSRKTRRR